MRLNVLCMADNIDGVHCLLLHLQDQVLELLGLDA